MMGRGQHGFGLARFDDRALLHDGDGVGDPRDGGNVVRDEDVAHVQTLLQIAQQIEDRLRHHRIQRGRDLVADDQPGLRRERAGEVDPLALAAGELARIA